jgi:hypothetical protein
MVTTHRAIAMDNSHPGTGLRPKLKLVDTPSYNQYPSTPYSTYPAALPSTPYSAHTTASLDPEACSADERSQGEE